VQASLALTDTANLATLCIVDARELAYNRASNQEGASV
jgi:hypothetical protein